MPKLLFILFLALALGSPVSYSQDKCSLIQQDSISDLLRSNCEMNFKALGCDQLEKDDRLISCAPERSGLTGLSSTDLAGCVWNGLKLTVEQLLDLKKIAQDLPEQIKNSFQRGEACNRSMSQKRELLNAFNLGLSDDRFKISENFLGHWLEEATCAQVSKLLSDRYNNYLDVWDRENRTLVNAGRAPKPITGSGTNLFHALRAAIESAGIRYNCYTPKFKAELICTGLTTLVGDTALGLGLLGAAAKIKRLVQSNKALLLDKGNTSGNLYLTLPVKASNSIEQKFLDLREKTRRKLLSPGEIKARTKVISEEISMELKKQGYSSELVDNKDSWVVMLTSVPLYTREGKTIYKGSKTLGAKYYFVPYVQANTPGLLGMQVDNSTAVILPIESIFKGTIGSSRTFLHEIRHLKFSEDLKKGKPSPYYGVVIADGEVPVTSVPGYTARLSLEELSTWHRSMKQTLAGVKDVTPMGFQASDEMSAVTQAKVVTEMGKSVQKLAAESRRTASQGQVTFSVDPYFKKVLADIPVFEDGKKIGTAKFWLVEGKSLGTHQENLGHLLRYLDEVEKTAQYHIEEGNRVLQGKNKVRAKPRLEIISEELYF